MTREEAIALFLAIQNGRGTGDLRDALRAEFGAGTIAIGYWNNGEFTLGVEYGILIGLMQAFGLTRADTDPPTKEE